MTPVPATEAVLLGRAARAALLASADALGLSRLPDAFHHHGPDGSHAHAFYLPEDADGDGALDHILIFAEAGIEPPVVRALANVERLSLGRRRVVVTPNWMGARLAGGMFGPALTWQAITPYVTPKWRLSKTGRERPQFAPEVQLTTEIVARGLPPPVAIEWQPSNAGVFANDFAVTGPGKIAARPPRDAVAAFPKLHFSEPVWGPLAFGFGAHFGLGVLLPAG